MMNVYKYDNHDGDIGIIIAPNYKKAMELYQKNYNCVVVENDADYRNGGVYLDELGPLKKKALYVVCER